MWQEYVVEYLDAYLPTSTYTMAQWQRLCNIAAKEGIDAGYSYADGYSITATGSVIDWSVSPDPSNDSDFITFTALKCWCNIYRSELANKAMDASMVQEGLSKIDTRNSLPSYRNNFSSPCELFNNMLAERYGDTNVSVLYNFATEEYDVT